MSVTKFCDVIMIGRRHVEERTPYVFTWSVKLFECCLAVDRTHSMNDYLKTKLLCVNIKSFAIRVSMHSYSCSCQLSPSTHTTSTENSIKGVLKRHGFVSKIEALL